MQIKYNLERSLRDNPPDYAEGTDHIKRTHQYLPDLVIVDDKGISLNVRDKDPDTRYNEGITFDTSDGVLYDRDLMVVEEREDGKRELISGYGRYFWFSKRGIDTYMVDVVKFTTKYDKEVAKLSLNTGKDHKAKGLPNTEGTILKGIMSAANKETFNWKSKNDCMRFLRKVTNGMKSDDQLVKIFKRFRKMKTPIDDVRGLTTSTANDLSEQMGLPHGGYDKRLDSDSFGRIGFNIQRRDDINIKLVDMIKLCNDYKVDVELYGFVQNVVPKNIKIQRQELLKSWNKSITWANNHLKISKKKYYYKGAIKFKGFHAQIRTPNPNDGGNPKERGIADVDGNILIDKDPKVSF